MSNNESSEQAQSTKVVVETSCGKQGGELEVHLHSRGTKHVFRFAVDDGEETAWLESLEQGGETYRHSRDNIPEVVLERVRAEGYAIELR